MAKRNKKHTRATPSGQPRSKSRFTRRDRKWFYANGFDRGERLERQLQAASYEPSKLIEAAQRFAEALTTWPKTKEATNGKA